MGIIVPYPEETGGWSFFIEWIQLLYTQQVATIQYAVSQSNQIRIKTGVRQGCPLSPLLFNLVIEMLGLTRRRAEPF